MKNEFASNKNRTSLTTTVERDCLQCDNFETIVVKNGGLSSHLLPNGKWSEPKACDKYNIRCKLDGEIKGYVFSPYEELIPYNCKLSKPKKKASFLRKLFQSFF